ncbi:MAG TPA: DUF169 domain-containing protein [Acidimicrobiales bacterium]|nr:DUF169 domain-containing protein [Acidimicrobiales bacterium]
MNDVDECRRMAEALTRALHLAAPPIAISFEAVTPSDVPAFDEPMSEPTPDGRAGRVPAGCVFWMRAVAATFTTAPADHGNCSVGRFTHGLATMEEIGGNSDVAALLESGWVDEAAVKTLPSVSAKPAAVTYGPLADAPRPPDVVLLRVNGRQLMVISDAIPGLRIEGKPQCHIVALAKEHGVAAASVGCALSRARTGMRPDEMTFAFPGERLAAVVDAIEQTAAVDTIVARYAGEDARRFGARGSAIAAEESQ